MGRFVAGTLESTQSTFSLFSGPTTSFVFNDKDTLQVEERLTGLGVIYSGDVMISLSQIFVE